MSFKDCLDQAVTQGGMTLEDAQQIKTKYDDLWKQTRNALTAKTMLLEDVGSEIDHRKRVALMSEEKRKGLIEELLNFRNWRNEADMPLALLSMLENQGRFTSFVADVEYSRRAILGEWEAELDQFMQEFRRGALLGDKRRTGKWVGNSQVQARMDNVLREILGQATDDAPAKAIAQAVTRVLEKSRVRFNDAGGAVGKLERYFPQHHTVDRLLEVGREAWVNRLMADGVLDRERMADPITGRPYPDADLRDMLRVAWDRITTDGASDMAASDGTGVPVNRGKGAMWKRHADHRFIHFKDADAWIAYAKEFGDPDPYHAVFQHLGTMARDIAFMEKFGPNPDRMFDYLKRYIDTQKQKLRPTETVIAEDMARLDELYRKLSIDVPEFAAKTARLSDVITEIVGLHRKQPKLERVKAPPTAAPLKGLQVDLAELVEATMLHRHLIIRHANILGRRNDGQVQAALRVAERRIKAAQDVLEARIGIEATRDARNRAVSHLTPSQQIGSELADPVHVSQAIDRSLDENLKAVEKPDPELDFTQVDQWSEKLVQLEEEARQLTQYLLPYWEDPTRQTQADSRIASEIATVLDGLRDPVVFASYARPDDYFNKMMKRVGDMWQLQRGAGNMPVSRLGANIMASSRNIMTAADLGSAFLSALSDPAFGQAARLRLGMGFARSHFAGVMAKTLGHMIGQMLGPDGRRQAIQAELLLDTAGHTLETEARMLSVTNVRNLSSYITDRVLTWSLLQAYTQAGKHVFGMDAMMFFADMADRPFAELPKKTQDSLTFSGIDPASWDTMRQAQLHNVKRGVWGSVDMLRPLEIRAVDPDLARRYHLMILRGTTAAVPEATMESRSMIWSGQPPGSLQGEALRSLTMYKSFATSVLLLHGRDWLRELRQSGWQPALASAATTLATGALLGGLVIALKDVKEGRDPRKWLDEKTVLDPSFWAAALLQGGGLGIFGDFLFADQNRFGGSFGATVLGPMGDRVESALKLTVGNAQQALQGKETRFAPEALRFADRNLPGHSLWFVSLLYQRMILDELQKKVDPDAYRAFSRVMRKRQRDYGQEYWWPMGETSPQRAPDLSRVIATE